MNARTPLWHKFLDELNSVTVPIVRTCLKGTTISNNNGYNDSGYANDGRYKDVDYEDGTLTDDNWCENENLAANDDGIPDTDDNGKPSDN